MVQRICAVARIFVVFGGVGLGFFSLELYGQSRGDLPSNLRTIKEPAAKDPQIRAPSADDFFLKGKKVFPKSFQVANEQFLPTQGISSGQAEEDYPVGPGDRFLINFWGRIEDNLIVQINSEGKLFIPRVGVIDANDLTYEQLQEQIEKKLNASLKNISYTISLYQPREFSVYVLGAVAKPGPVLANAKMRASQVIEKAGGVNSVGSKQFIEVRRKSNNLRVDLLRYLTQADFGLNPYVTDSDIIFVPNLQEFVTITGAIVRPGTFEIRETRRLVDVIEHMGGISVYADRTAPIRVSRLMPDGRRQQLQVFQQTREKLGPNEFLLSEMMLQNADEIYIPSSNLLIPSRSDSVFVTGEVKAPGTKPYQVSMSVEEYIGSAGGLTSRADFSKAVIYKADGSVVPLQPRMAMEPGDTIYIPERTFKFWQDHLTIITTFISLATSIIVLSGK